MNFTKLALIEKGKKSYTCRICDYVKYASFPATGHSFADGVCSVCGYWDWSYTAFDECLHVNRFGTWITKPTCTADGEVRLDCNYCTDAQTVTVPAHGHEFAEDICIHCNAEIGCVHSYENGVCTLCGEADPDYVAPVIPGDVDGNGVLNIIDIARLYGNVKGSAQLEDTAVADFNGDGKLNIIDVAQAYAQVKG